MFIEKFGTLHLKHKGYFQEVRRFLITNHRMIAK